MRATSITRSEDFVDKGINYRMSPENAACLRAAAIDCCVLANNHVLDWGKEGLCDTLSTLRKLGIETAGAGRDAAEAAAPAALPVAGPGRVLVFSFALASSGTPRGWAAKSERAGVNCLNDLSEASAGYVCDQVMRKRQADDIVVVSLHWGPNWGYDIEDEQRRFAQALIDRAGVSIIHGHSSHHAKAIEVYCNKLILYGCGDFLNDYEGIGGNAEYRGDLALMYFADIKTRGGDLVALHVVPLQIHQFRLIRPCVEDVDWMQRRLERESRRFGTTVMASGRSALKVKRTADSSASATSDQSRSRRERP